VEPKPISKVLNIENPTVLAMGSYKKDWEELAGLDPKWAIVSDPKKRGGAWKEGEFFESGEQAVKIALGRISESEGKLNFGKALDFGCGIGRLSRALSKRFKRVYGVDVSPKMIAEARKLNKGNKRLEFIHNERDDLLVFESRSLDFIYSEITLQHIPEIESIENYIKEFVRILKPRGILYFQLPSRQRYSRLMRPLLKFRGDMYYGLTGLGIQRDFCFSTLKLAPYMQMSFLPMERVAQLLNGEAEIIGIYERNSVETRYVVRKK
jgi:SAM-dependent methyltransferase